MRFGARCVPPLCNSLVRNDEERRCRGQMKRLKSFEGEFDNLLFYSALRYIFVVAHSLPLWLQSPIFQYQKGKERNAITETNKQSGETLSFKWFRLVEKSAEKRLNCIKFSADCFERARSEERDKERKTPNADLKENERTDAETINENEIILRRKCACRVVSKIGWNVKVSTVGSRHRSLSLLIVAGSGHRKRQK